MADTHIRHGNLLFLPVIRARLNFAILVQKVLRSEELPWDSRQDLIAIGLPRSSKEHVIRGIEELPTISVLLISNGDMYREVLPITPCDAFIEATRFAIENDHQFCFIDRDIEPGNLVRSSCVRDPNWPDDQLVHELGINKYLELISPHLAQPPSRHELVDSWRESYICQQLASLRPFWRRIFVIVDAPLVMPIIKRLERTNSTVNDDIPSGALFDFRRVSSLKPEVLYEYLDDYPNIVEQFERSRLSAGHMFDKRKKLIELVQSIAGEAKDINISTRQHQSFLQYLFNLLEGERRRIPLPDVLIAACGSCFGESFAERVYCRLANYHGQISVERIGRRSSVGDSLIQVKVEVDANERGMFGRGCNPSPPSYKQLPRPPVPMPNRDEDSEVQGWPPEVRFRRHMWSKLQRLIQANQTRTRTAEFRGSIEGGIDERRTLRSMYSGSPKIYVKQRKRYRQSSLARDEPVVWIFDEAIDQPYAFNSSMEDDNERLISSIQVFGFQNPQMGDVVEVIYRSNNGAATINFGKLVGMITFGCFELEGDAFCDQFGDQSSARIPDHDDFEHPRMEHQTRGCVHSDFVSIVNDGATWLEVAVLTALKYAKNSITVVLPRGIRIPNSIRQQVITQGKTIIYESISNFSHLEREKLANHYLIRRQREPGGRDVEAVFAHIMKRYWSN